MEIAQAEWRRDLSNNAIRAVDRDFVDRGFADKDFANKDFVNKAADSKAAADIVFVRKDFADMAERPADKGLGFDSYFLDAKKRRFDLDNPDLTNKKSEQRKSANM